MAKISFSGDVTLGKIAIFNLAYSYFYHELLFGNITTFDSRVIRSLLKHDYIRFNKPIYLDESKMFASVFFLGQSLFNSHAVVVSDKIVEKLTLNSAWDYLRIILRMKSLDKALQFIRENQIIRLDQEKAETRSDVPILDFHYEKIVVIGAGSIGSWLTALLASVYGAQVYVFDFDLIEESNCLYIPRPLRKYISWNKALALEAVFPNVVGIPEKATYEKIEEINPNIVFNAADTESEELQRITRVFTSPVEVAYDGKFAYIINKPYQFPVAVNGEVQYTYTHATSKEPWHPIILAEIALFFAYTESDVPFISKVNLEQLQKFLLWRLT